MAGKHVLTQHVAQVTAVAEVRPSVAGSHLECSLLMNWARPLPTFYWQGVSPNLGEPVGLGPPERGLWSLRYTQEAPPRGIPCRTGQ